VGEEGTKSVAGDETSKELGKKKELEVHSSPDVSCSFCSSLVTS
jgi:hypothetical protein